MSYLDQSVIIDLENFHTYYYVTITKDGVLESSTQLVPMWIMDKRKKDFAVLLK